MSPIVVGAIGIGFTLLLFFLGMPVGLAMGVVAFAGLSYLSSVGVAGDILRLTVFTNVQSYPITLVIPLFVLMGSIAAESGMGKRLYDTAYKWIGQYRGGLAMATMGGCAGFGAVCGDSVATAATMSKLAFPQMERYNYKPELSAGAIATGGTLALMIPPSLGFVIYALLTETSIGHLFIAGIFPGIVHAILYVLVILVWTRLDPSVGPGSTAKIGIREKLASLSGTGETVVLFALVMGGLLVGWFSTSEAGAVGAGGIILITLIRRMLNWQKFWRSLLETIRLVAMLVMVLVFALYFARFIAMSRLPFELADWIVTLDVPPFGVLFAMLLSYLVFGCIMSFAAMTVITLPIYYPVAVSLGFDPIWFGVLVVLMAEIALITPPIGLNVWVISGMLPHIKMEKIFKGVLIFLIADLTILGLLLAFPRLALYLPSLMR